MDQRRQHLIVRRLTEILIGAVLVVRLTILGSNYLQSRHNVPYSPPPAFHPFDTHIQLLRFTSLIVVVLVFSLAFQVRRIASATIVLCVLAAGVGYAVSSFLGPSRWVLTVPGPFLNPTGDPAGWAELLTIDFVLGGLLLVATIRVERRNREGLPRLRLTPDL